MKTLSSVYWLVGFVTGNPWVFLGPPVPVPVVMGTGLFGYGYGYRHIITNHHQPPPSVALNKVVQKTRGALGTQENTGGVGYDSHSSIMVSYFDFLIILG